jgi:mycofactocin system glycosyltransferase
MPLGLPIELDADTRQLADDLLFGGSPTRVLRLSATGIKAFTELQAGIVRTAAGARLARALTDAGLAHPRPQPSGASVTIVIPVRDRGAELARCLSALGGSFPVLVVDDESADPAEIADVATDHGAGVIRRDRNGGPAAARNEALAHVDTELIAFIDSDCVPPATWIGRLAGHFADPRVAAVAPRIVPHRAGPPPARPGDAARYLAMRSPLDLGRRPARVQPFGRVSYVPTAALLVRRSALGERQFDESLRYGEDVDLVWWLHQTGWRVRYDPSVEVAHVEPTCWPDLLHRRYRYGTSAAPLSRRHGDAVSPLVLQPWPVAIAAALLAGWPLLAGAAYLVAVERLRRRLVAHAIPTERVATTVAEGVTQTVVGLGRWALQFVAPVLAIAALGARPKTRFVIATVVGAPIAAEWRRHRPRPGPVRFLAGMLADEMAYGAGVWRGCLRERTLMPVLPQRLGWPGHFRRSQTGRMR